MPLLFVSFDVMVVSAYDMGWMLPCIILEIGALALRAAGQLYLQSS
jgi:hypothetical protein